MASSDINNQVLPSIEEVDENKLSNSEDDIDETFDEKPVHVNLPVPLSNDELNKVHELMKTKSNKEISEIVTKIMTSEKEKKEIEKMKIESSILKNLNTSSKRELLNLLDLVLHQQNKHIVFENANMLETVTEDKKESHDELRKKLHSKIYMTNKNNMKKMYEKMSENLMSMQQESEQQTEQTSEQNVNSEITSEKKNKKKKNKLNRQKLQNQLMEQMANLLQEQQQ